MENKDNHIIILFPNDQNRQQLILEDLNEIQIHTLAHPKAQTTLVIILDDQFYELQAVQLYKYSTWFINQHISSSKSIYLANKLDPRFYLLPYLEKSGSKYSPIDQLIFPLGPGISPFPLLNNISKWKMQEMCDVNDKFDDMLFFRYNEEKVLSWLKNKVIKLSKIVQKQRKQQLLNTLPTFVSSFNLGSKAQANIPQPTQTNEEPIREDILQALELVIDLLSDSLTDKLLKEFQATMSELMASSSSNKRKADWEEALVREKEEMEQKELTRPNNNPPSSTTQTKPTSSTKSSNASSIAKNQSAAKNTPSITSFFGKK